MFSICCRETCINHSLNFCLYRNILYSSLYLKEQFCHPQTQDPQLTSFCLFFSLSTANSIPVPLNTKVFTGELADNLIVDSYT